MTSARQQQWQQKLKELQVAPNTVKSTPQGEYKAQNKQKGKQKPYVKETSQPVRRPLNAENLAKYESRRKQVEALWADQGKRKKKVFKLC